MAEKTSSSGKRSGNRRQAAAADPSRVAAAALDQAAEFGWRRVTLADVANRSGLSLAQVLAIAPTRPALVAVIVSEVDRRVAEGGAADPQDGVRDRLFDLLMRRFDALNERRDGILAIVRDGRRDPATIVSGSAHVLRAMAMTLESAGVSTGGLMGIARVHGLAAVYAAAFRAWQADDSTDMAPTMAALDKALARAGMVAERLGGRSARPATAGGDAPPEP